ncbi:hypothetical protein N5W20_05235 [Candidatus Kirkpatrickella diaphorinae]|uniref:Uncharacterized protein n=1 Tax=Candidatus Kirkpatrickella diaphorinae TaxID=2984322 RepID=A0ABY6GIC6_9PROT|nr:hypothetical protein [Candidatus Kirkpatrickella diaphorinae]UYH50533.1 hypothetical protein N5W20_05235 [Candidatus Kirkpatrickella diaphorinae]
MLLSFYRRSLLLCAIWSSALALNAVEARAAPKSVTLTTPATPAIESLARQLNAEAIKDARNHHDDPIILVTMADLGRSKRQQALFTQLQSARLCGAIGCATSIYLGDKGRWTEVYNDVTGDITILPTAHHGLYDLGLSKGRKRIWNGTEYIDPLDR